jgi:hypothetical protein
MGPGVVLAAGALVAAVVYGLRFAARGEKGRIGAGVKTASIGLLVPALALAGQAGGGSWFWLVPLGLALGALGDLVPGAEGGGGLPGRGGGLRRGIWPMRAGSSCGPGTLGFDGLSAGGAGAGGAGGAGRLDRGLAAPRTGNLRGPVRGYVAVIGLMGLAVVLLPAASGAGGAAAGGGAVHPVRPDAGAAAVRGAATGMRQALLSLALWPAYWGGQALIAWAALVFWGVPG